MRFKLYEFFIHNEDSRDYLANQRLCEETLFFEDEEEMENFKHYFYEYLQKYDEYLKKIQCDDKRKIINQMQNEYDQRLALKAIYLDFENYNNCSDTQELDGLSTFDHKNSLTQYNSGKKATVLFFPDHNK